MNSDVLRSRDGRIAALGFWTATAFVTAWTAIARSAGLNPQSLWFDDLWVASLTRLESLIEAVSLAVPVPPGFVAILWCCRRLVPDPELAVQTVPFLASLVSIPILAVAVSRASGSHALGAAAGTLIAVNPAVTHHSVYAKQYTVDVLVTAIVLALAVNYFRGRAPRDFVFGAATSAVALFVSFPSVFATVPFVNLGLLLALRSFRSRPQESRSVIRTALAFDIAAGLSLLLWIVGRSNPQVVSYWKGGFLPTDSLKSGWDFLASNGLEAIQGALPAVLVHATPLVAVGLVWLLARPATRFLALWVALFYGTVLVASAAQAYPIAGGARLRTALFSFPVTVFLFVMGIDALTRWIPGRSLVNTTSCGLLLGVMVLKPVKAHYFPLNHSAFVRIMEQVATDADGIVIWPSAGYLAGYYSEWPISARVPEGPGLGLEIHLNRPGTLTLPSGTSEARAAALDRYLETGRYSRVLYLTTRAPDGEEATVFEVFARHGYQALEPWRSNIRTRLIVFQLVE